MLNGTPDRVPQRAVQDRLFGKRLDRAISHVAEIAIGVTRSISDEGRALRPRLYDLGCPEYG